MRHRQCVVRPPSIIIAIDHPFSLESDTHSTMRASKPPQRRRLKRQFPGALPEALVRSPLAGIRPPAAATALGLLLLLGASQTQGFSVPAVPTAATCHRHHAIPTALGQPILIPSSATTSSEPGYDSSPRRLMRRRTRGSSKRTNAGTGTSTARKNLKTNNHRNNGRRQSSSRSSSSYNDDNDGRERMRQAEDVESRMLLALSSLQTRVKTEAETNTNNNLNMDTNY